MAAKAEREAAKFARRSGRQGKKIRCSQISCAAFCDAFNMPHLSPYDDTGG
jgi:hypothetical protein